MNVADASKWGDVIMVMIPDQHQAKVYKSEIAPHLTDGKMRLTTRLGVQFHFVHKGSLR